MKQKMARGSIYHIMYVATCGENKLRPMGTTFLVHLFLFIPALTVPLQESSLGVDQTRTYCCFITFSVELNI